MRVCRVLTTVALAFLLGVGTTQGGIHLPLTEPILGYGLENAFPGIAFDQPVAISSPPGETNSLYIAERGGRIFVIPDLTDPKPEVFLDLRDRTWAYDIEAGLLGFTFHPEFQINRRFFVFRMASSGLAVYDTLSEFSAVSGVPVDPLSEKVIFAQEEIRSYHNGGCIQFGPDGYLYVAVGFEGITGLERQRQSIDEGLFGGILRIDVDLKARNLLPNPHPASTPNYRIPKDNPFIGITQFNGKAVNTDDVCTEFFAIGLRNPWRFSFHPETGQLICGDVGDGFWEEINLIEKGGNYGWPFLDGSETVLLPGAPANLKPPRYEYFHGTGIYDGRCVVGGLVYQGKLPGLYGKYLFADFWLGHVWAMDLENAKAKPQWLTAQAGIVTFGLDPRDGEVLVANFHNGSISKLVHRTSEDAGIPRLLSEVGAFSNVAALTTTNVLPFEVISEFWSDGAIKSRWFSLEHAQEKIVFHETNSWEIPTGAIFIKHFDLEITNGLPASRRRLETRFLVKTTNAAYGLTYRWNKAQTDAELVPPEGSEEWITVYDQGEPRPQKWVYPGWEQCKSCHTEAGGHVLGFNTLQLNRPVTRDSKTTNQIDWLASLQTFVNANEIETTRLPKFSSLHDSNAPLQHKVRSYLNSNCAQCHQPGGPSFGTFWDARITTPIEDAKIVDSILSRSPPPMSVVSRRNLQLSYIYDRVRVSSPHEAFRMPPLGTSIAHPLFVETLTNWILTLPERDWLSRNIGSPILEGSAEQQPGRILLWGSGRGSTEDDIFFLGKRAYGTTTIAALLHNATGPQSREAGITVRATPEEGSPFAALYASGSDVIFSIRTATNVVPEVVAKVRARAISWLALVRNGSTISGHYRDASTNWQRLASVTLSLPTDIYAGLFVASGAASTEYAKAEFADYYLRSRQINMTPSDTGFIAINAIDDRLNISHSLQFETSDTLENWDIQDSVGLSEVSSTRRELRIEKRVDPVPSQFFRIRRIEDQPAP